MADYVKTLIDAGASDLEAEVSSKYNEMLRNIRDIIKPEDISGDILHRDEQYYKNIDTITNKEEAKKEVMKHHESEIAYYTHKRDNGRSNQLTYETEIKNAYKAKDRILSRIDELTEYVNGAEASREKQWQKAQKELSQIDAEIATGIERKGANLEKIKERAAKGIQEIQNVGSKYGVKTKEAIDSFNKSVKKSSSKGSTKVSPQKRAPQRSRNEAINSNVRGQGTYAYTQTKLEDIYGINNSGLGDVELDAKYYENIKSITNKDIARDVVSDNFLREKKIIKHMKKVGDIDDKEAQKQMDALVKNRDKSLAAIEAATEEINGMAATRRVQYERRREQLRTAMNGYHADAKHDAMKLGHAIQESYTYQDIEQTAMKDMGGFDGVREEVNKELVKAVDSSKKKTPVKKKMGTVKPTSNGDIVFDGSVSLSSLKSTVSNLGLDGGPDSVAGQIRTITAGIAEKLRKKVKQNPGVELTDEEYGFLNNTAKDFWGNKDLKFKDKLEMDKKVGSIKQQQRDRVLKSLGGAKQLIIDKLTEERKAQGLDTDEEFLNNVNDVLNSSAAALQEFKAPVQNKKQAWDFVVNTIKDKHWVIEDDTGEETSTLPGTMDKVLKLIKDNGLEEYFGAEKPKSNTTKKLPDISPRVLAQLFGDKRIAKGTLTPDRIHSSNPFGSIDDGKNHVLNTTTPSRTLEQDIDAEELWERIAESSLKAMPYVKGEKYKRDMFGAAGETSSAYLKPFYDYIESTYISSFPEPKNPYEGKPIGELTSDEYQKYLKYLEDYDKWEKESGPKEVENRAKRYVEENIVKYRKRIAEEERAREQSKKSWDGSTASRRRMQKSDSAKRRGMKRLGKAQHDPIVFEKDNSYIAKNFRDIGTPIDSLVDSRLSAKKYQEKVIENAAARGLIASIEGDTVTLTAKEDPDKVTTIKMASLEEGNTITKGGMHYANMAHAVQESNGPGQKPITGVVTSYELQWKNLANMMASVQKDVDGKPILDENGDKIPLQTKLTSAALNGDQAAVESMGANAFRNAVNNAPSNLSESVANESKTDFTGVKTDEQAYIQKGMFDLTELVKSFAVRNEEALRTWYEGHGVKNFDPWEVRSDLLEAADTIYALKAHGMAEEEIGKMFGEDSLEQLLFNSSRNDEGKYISTVKNKKGETLGEFETSFNSLMTAMDDLIAGGLIPDLTSIKEESFLSGRMSTTSSRGIQGFGAFTPESHRGPAQAMNYLRRKEEAFDDYEGNNRHVNPWVSANMKNAGINPNSMERYQYTGAQADDAEINRAIQKFVELGKISSEVAMFMSTEEGGVLMSPNMAKSLTAYREETKAANDFDVNVEFLEDLGISVNDVKALKTGEAMELSPQVMEGGEAYTRDIVLNEGDIVRGLKRTEDGLTLMIDALVELENGGKVIGEEDARLDARIMPSQQVWEELMDEMGLSYINPEGKKITPEWLMESQHDDARHIGHDVSGRLSSIVNQAYDLGYTTQEIAQAFEGTRLGKAIEVRDGKLSTSLSVDAASNKYKYYNKETGRTEDFFDYDEYGDIVDQNQLLTTIVEDLSHYIKAGLLDKNTQSDIEKVGRKLLGDEQYEATKRFQDEYVNQAKEYPYMETTGSGNVELIASKARAKFSEKERNAHRREIGTLMSGTTDETKKVALQALHEAEELAQNQQSKENIEAKKKIKRIEADQALNRYDGRSKETQGAVLTDRELEDKLVIGVKDGQITFDGVVQEGLVNSARRDPSGKTGSTVEDYNKTIIGAARLAMEAAGKVGMVIQRYNDKMLVTDFGAIKLGNGNREQGATDKIFNGLFQQDFKGNYSISSLSQAGRALDELAHDKHSTLFKQADQTKIGNSSYVKLMGTNTGDKKWQEEHANDVYITSEKLRGMMSSEEGSTKKDVFNNIKQLTYMKAAQQGTEEEMAPIVEEAIQHYNKLYSEMNKKELQQIEQELIAEIINMVKSGEMDLTTMLGRYPSTSGRDMRYANLKVNDEIGNEKAMLVSRGMAATFNGDFDGDKIRARIMGLQYGNDFHSYYQAAQGAQEMKAYHTAVAKRMEALNEAADIYPERDVEKTNRMVSLLGDKKKDFVAGLMSKKNKKYVGQFSNINTNARNLLEGLDEDEVAITRGGGIDVKQAGYMGMVRSFLEALEQDSISAKKISQRLNVTEEYAINELDALRDALQNGDLMTAFSQAKKLDILKTDEEGNFVGSRQYNLNQASIEVANGTDFESIYGTSSPEVLMKEAFGALPSILGKHGLKDLSALGKATKPRSDRERALNEQSRKRNKNRKTTLKGTGKAKEEAKKVAQEALTKADKAVAKTEGVEKEVTSLENEVEENNNLTENLYTAMKTRDGATYDKDHVRDLHGYGNNNVGHTGGSVIKETGRKVSGVGVSITEIDSLGGYIKGMENYNPYNKDDPKYSAMGTYQHKITELLGRTKTTDLGSAFDVGGEKVREEFMKTRQQLIIALNGELTDELEAQLINTAENAFNIMKEISPELAGENAQQEMTLGGKLHDTDLLTNRYISGQADVYALKDDDSGITIADYKFSKDGSEKTVAKRIMQQSMYVAMRREELAEQIRAINAGEMKGDADALQKELSAINNGNINGNNTLDIVRATKEGIEVVQARVLDLDKVLMATDLRAEYVELDRKLSALEQSGQAGGEEGKKIEQRMDEILELSLTNASDILHQAGIFHQNGTYYNMDGTSATQRFVKGDNNSLEMLGQGMTFKEAKQKQPSNGPQITTYLKNERAQSRILQDIERTKIKASSSSGSELRMHQQNLATLQKQLNVLKQRQKLYDKENGTLNGVKLSDKEIERIEREIVDINMRREAQIQKIGANMKMEQGLLDKMLNGFKQQFSNFLGMNLTYQLVGKVRQLFSEIVQLTKELDANMVDIQIASGNSAEEVESMMKGFNALAMKTGRSTSEVATAANECDLKAIYSKSGNAFTNLRHALVVKTLV